MMIAEMIRNATMVTTLWSAPNPKPMVIDRNKYANSSGSFIAARKRTMDSAPTRPSESARDDFTIGTTYKVRVTHYVPTQQLYMASIRALDVANNPYIALSRNPAVEHHGRVQDAIGDNVTVYLDKNDSDMIAVGRIAANEGTSHLQSGDRVTVTVRSLDVEECELWLDLCESPAD